MQDPVFLISLKKDVARRERLKERFKSYDDFIFIQGVDGKNLSANEYFSILMPTLKTHNKLLTPAETGCALSHIKAYEAFLASDSSLALIIEDDVMGDDESIKFAFSVARKMPENSVLICGCQDGLNARFSAFGKRVKGELAKPVFKVLSHSLSSINRAAAYIITHQSAQALLNEHKKALLVSDLWGYLVPKCDLEMYFCDIFAHPVDLSDSNINNERDERGYNKLNLTGLLRSVKYIILTRIMAKFCGYERIFKRA